MTDTALSTCKELPAFPDPVFRIQGAFVAWESDVAGPGLPIKATPFLQRRDTVIGEAIERMVGQYEDLRKLLAEVIRERDGYISKWDAVCHERDDLKALLEERTQPEKAKPKGK